MKILDRQVHAFGDVFDRKRGLNKEYIQFNKLNDME